MICLQEVPSSGEYNLAGWLASELGMHWAWAPTNRAEAWRALLDSQDVPSDEVADIPNFGAGVAILSRWPLDEVSSIDLPGLQGRTALGAVVRRPGNGFAVATAHFSAGYRNGQQRCEQAKLVAELAGAKATGVHPTIVAGDFNAIPESEELRILTGLAGQEVSLPLVDAWRFARGKGETVARRNALVVDGPEPDSRLDYILVEPQWNAAHCHVDSVRRIGARPSAIRRIWPSDHFGVLVTLGE